MTSTDHFRNMLAIANCEFLDNYNKNRVPLATVCHCLRTCSSRIGLYIYQLTHRCQGQSVRHLRRRSPCACVFHQVCYHCLLMLHSIKCQLSQHLTITTKNAYSFANKSKLFNCKIIFILYFTTYTQKPFSSMTLPDVFKDVSANFVFAAMAAISFCRKSLHSKTHQYAHHGHA